MAALCVDVRNVKDKKSAAAEINSCAAGEIKKEGKGE